MEIQEVLRVARIQLALMLDTLPEACLGGANLDGSITVLKDVNGEDILFRVRLLSGQGEGAGYADIAIAPELGSVILSIAQGAEWDELAVRLKVQNAGFAGEGNFIAYAYPRIGLEIPGDGDPGVRSVYDWIRSKVIEIRDASLDDYAHGDYSYSLLESMSNRTREVNRLRYGQLVQILLSSEDLGVSLWRPLVQGQVQERIKYNGSIGGHACFELKQQQAKEWCVPACVDMLLSFYRYSYNQGDIARVLGQEEPTGNEVELPVGREYKVAETIAFLSCGALTSRLFPREGAFWEVLSKEVLVNRPLVLFTGRHSRVVVGYSVTKIGTLELRGLVLFDPAGFKICWEAYVSNRESVLFTADLRHKYLKV